MPRQGACTKGTKNMNKKIKKAGLKTITVLTATTAAALPFANTVFADEPVENTPTEITTPSEVGVTDDYESAKEEFYRADDAATAAESDFQDAQAAENTAQENVIQAETDLNQANEDKTQDTNALQDGIDDAVSAAEQDIADAVWIKFHCASAPFGSILSNPWEMFKEILAKIKSV